jgi:hypothetical protein
MAQNAPAAPAPMIAIRNDIIWGDYWIFVISLFRHLDITLLRDFEITRFRDFDNLEKNMALPA